MGQYRLCLDVFLQTTICWPILLNPQPSYPPSLSSYGTDLDTDSNGDDKDTGTLKCKSESPGATSYRPSFLHSKWGRSELSASAARVDSQMQRFGVQTYNEIKSVSPTMGSEEGGTKITLTSENIAADQSQIDIEVGGMLCRRCG